MNDDKPVECGKCKGKGTIVLPPHPGRKTTLPRRQPCHVCGGSGFLKRMQSLTEYASKAQPMSTMDNLREQADERWEPGTGPWSKKDDLDQVDLVKFQMVAEGYELHSDPRGMMAGCIERLVEEVRRVRSWPTPPDVGTSYEYVEPKD